MIWELWVNVEDTVHIFSEIPDYIGSVGMNHYLKRGQPKTGMLRFDTREIAIEYEKLEEANRRQCPSSFVYVPSKRNLMMLGCPTDNIWRCQLDDGESVAVVPRAQGRRTRGDGAVRGRGGTHWVERGKVAKWEKVNCIISRGLSFATLTSTEEYIICAGGCDELFIVDIRDDAEYCTMETRVNRPFPQDHLLLGMTITDGKKEEILAIGWIRREFNSNELMEILPFHLVELMARWFAVETLHVFSAKRNEDESSLLKVDHFVIAVNDLLPQ